VGTHPNRIAANCGWSCWIPPGPRILDDPARASVSGAGCALPPAADIAGVDMARAKMGPMETSALWWRKSPWDLDGKLAFILAIPVMNARGMHFDQNETSRLNAIFKPTLEVLCPMRPELVLVTN
jgi:hypothetical protein